MKMSRGKRGVWLALAVLTAGAATACETGTLDPGPDVDRASLNVHANVTATTVVGLSLEVTAADIDPALIFNIPITDGVAVGTVQVPAGSARLFTLHAFDAGGVETHRGSVTVDVSSGANPPLQITLMPLDGDREIIATLGSIVVTVSPASATTTVGDSVELTGVVLDSVGEPIPEAVVAWATLAPGVAVVDSRGMVTGVATGDAWIVATYGLVGASSLIQVQAAVGSVEVDPPSATVEVGTTVQLTAVVRDTEGDPLDRTVTWTSSDEGVATVDQDGLVTGVSAGPATISASVDGVSGQSEITVSGDVEADVALWGRHVESFDHAGYTGNPFELEFSATFTHATADPITMPGYYAGGDVFRVEFMPTATGTWTWETESGDDAALDGLTGSVQVSASGARGLLRGGTSGDPRKWEHADGTFNAVPAGPMMQVFAGEGDTISDQDWGALCDWLADHEYTMVATLLTLKDEWGGDGDEPFTGNWTNHEFDTARWDRFVSKLEALAQRGLGAYVMFYADDGARPPWSGQSSTEALLLRYAVARLAAFPILIWETGTDIAEYRSQADINWFGAQLAALDPYDHPRSSRRAGGSGDITMADRNFESFGDQTANMGDNIRPRFDGATMPVGQFDVWGENRSSHPAKNHTAADIRRGAWMCAVAGSCAYLIRGGDGFFHLNNYASDIESEQWHKLVNPYIRALGPAYGDMVPADALVGSPSSREHYALADPARSRILYMLVGEDHSYDPGDGGSLTINLTGESGTWTGEWFNPRDGSTSVPSGSPYSGGSSHTQAPPSDEDWILLLTRQP